MTSRPARIKDLAIGSIGQPRTPLEEILLVVESNNEIVSEIIDVLNKILDEMEKKE